MLTQPSTCGFFFFFFVKDAHKKSLDKHKMMHILPSPWVLCCLCTPLQLVCLGDVHQEGRGSHYLKERSPGKFTR